MTNEMKAKRFKLYKQGKSFFEMGEALGVSSVSVRRWFEYHIQIDLAVRTPKTIADARMKHVTKWLEENGHDPEGGNISPRVRTSIVNGIRMGKYKYEIRDEYGVTDEEIRTVICEHYQRRVEVTA